MEDSALRTKLADERSPNIGRELIELSTQYRLPNFGWERQQEITARYQSGDDVFKAYMGFLPDADTKNTYSSISPHRAIVPFIADADARRVIRGLHAKIATFSPTLWSLRNSPFASIRRYYVVDRSKTRLNTLRVRLNKTAENPHNTHADLYIVGLHGNGGSAHEVLENMLRVAKDLIETKKADIGTIEILSFDFRGSVASPGPHEGLDDLANQAVDQICELLNEGIPPEKICLYGHSLGGLTGVNAAHKLKKKGPTLVHYFGDRAPNSIVDVVKTAIPVGASLVSFFCDKGRHDGAALYIELPPTHRACLASKTDGTIPFEATLVDILRTRHGIEEGIVVERLPHMFPINSLPGPSDENPFFLFCLQRVIANQLKPTSAPRSVSTPEQSRRSF